MPEASPLPEQSQVKMSLHDRVHQLKDGDMAAEKRMYSAEVMERTLEIINELVEFHCQDLAVDSPEQFRSGFSPGYDPEQLMMSQSTLGNILYSLKEQDLQNLAQHLVNLDVEIAHEAYHHRVEKKFPSAAAKTAEAGRAMFENEDYDKYYSDLGEQGARLYSIKVIDKRVGLIKAGQIPNFLQGADIASALKTYDELREIISEELKMGSMRSKQ